MRTLSSINITVLSVVALLFASGCQKDEKVFPVSGTDVTGHFINTYIIPDSISIGNAYFDTDSTWTLIFKGDDITHQYKDSAMFRKLSESLGDTSYHPIQKRPLRIMHVPLQEPYIRWTSSVTGIFSA